MWYPILIWEKIILKIEYGNQIYITWYKKQMSHYSFIFILSIP